MANECPAQRVKADPHQDTSHVTVSLQNFRDKEKTPKLPERSISQSEKSRSLNGFRLEQQDKGIKAFRRH